MKVKRPKVRGRMESGRFKQNGEVEELLRPQQALDDTKVSDEAKQA